MGDGLRMMMLRSRCRGQAVNSSPKIKPTSTQTAVRVGFLRIPETTHVPSNGKESTSEGLIRQVFQKSR